MGRARFRGRNQRAATATPQDTQSPWKPVVDLTGDGLPVSGSAPTRMALPLGPASGYKTNTTIAVPLDPKQSPAYLFQQMALLRNRARVQPSFSSAVRPGLESGTSSELGPEDKENTPTPNSRRPKDKPEKKSRLVASKTPLVSGEQQEKTSPKAASHETSSGVQERNSKKRRSKARLEDEKDNDHVTSDLVGVESPERPRKRSKSRSKSTSKKSKKNGNKYDDRGQQGEEGENTQVENVEAESGSTAPGSTGKSKKRKRDAREAEEQKISSAEAKALTQLREILPSKRVSRVQTQLRREMGCEPTDTTVAVATARDTIIDLARQQVIQTERSYQAIQAELLRMLKAQNKKLRRWERRARTTIGVLRSEDPGSDSDAIICSLDESGSESAEEEEEEEEEEPEEEEPEQEPEPEPEPAEKESPKRKKNKRGRHSHHHQHQHRLVSPVSICRRATTEEPQPRAAGCQSGVQ